MSVHHAKNEYRDMEMKLHAFLFFSLAGYELLHVIPAEPPTLYPLDRRPDSPDSNSGRGSKQKIPNPFRQ